MYFQYTLICKACSNFQANLYTVLAHSGRLTENEAKDKVLLQKIRDEHRVARCDKCGHMDTTRLILWRRFDDGTGLSVPIGEFTGTETIADNVVLSK